MNIDISQKEIVYDIKNLDVWYGDLHAVKNVTMTIPAREVTAIIGPSGCGKSTFIKVLNRMVEMVPNASIKGDVNLYQQSIFDHKVNLVNLRTMVGMVFQKPNPFPMSIYENVAFAPKHNTKQSKAQLDELVETCLKQASLWDEVKDRLQASAMDLSGGQQQRLCIARALANKPEVILMDEPTSALDPIATSKIEELISELKNQYNIIIVTHNMQQASRISDQTAFFLNGDLIEMGPTEQIFLRPNNKLTEDYTTGRFG